MKLMQILLVNIHVKAEQLEAFQAASIENARSSAEEPGVARFDFIQQADDPTRFVLIEAYRDSEAMAAHKETAHYKAWAAKTEGMFAEPRTRARYSNVYPGDQGW